MSRVAERKEGDARAAKKASTPSYSTSASS